jgi:hypothetical protein
MFLRGRPRAWVGNHQHDGVRVLVAEERNPMGVVQAMLVVSVLVESAAEERTMLVLVEVMLAAEDRLGVAWGARLAVLANLPDGAAACSRARKTF